MNGGNTTMQLCKIILATDFSPLSSAATNYACEFAAKFGAELHVVHTLDYHPGNTPMFEMGLAVNLPVKESRAAAQKAIEKVLDPSWQSSNKVVFAILDGSPKSEIIQYARKEKCDLIVMATHGRTGLGHVLMGSVAETVVRTAPCPVMTVRPVEHTFKMP